MKKKFEKKNGFEPKRRVYSFWQVVTRVLISLVIVQAFFWIGYSVYLLRQQVFQKPLIGIFQTCKSADSLPSEYLMEMLDLSKEKNLLCQDIDVVSLTAKLKKNPVIESALVSMRDPPYLEIKYSLRSPVAYVKDIENGALDEKGTLIPFAPFYFPKLLPSVILGEKEAKWKWADTIDPQKQAALFEVRSFFEDAELCGWKLVALDLSRCEELSSARMEIIAILQNQEADNSSLFFIRLSKKLLRESLKDFFLVFEKEKLFDSKAAFYVVDMRHPQTLLWDAF